MSISGSIEPNVDEAAVGSLEHEEPQAKGTDCGVCTDGSCSICITNALLKSIKPAKEVKHHRRILIYSDPGAGKTVLSATAPKPVVVDTENGAASINNHPELANHAMVVKFKSLFQLEQIVQRLADNDPAFDFVETLVIDTLSNLHKSGLAQTVEEDWQKNPNTVNRYVAETEHHTENNERIRRIVSSLNAVDRNIIINCHAKKIERKDKSLIFSPDFSDKLTNSINALVDMVGYLYEKEDSNGNVNRILRLRSNGNIVAKTRFAQHPAEIVNPTWRSLFDALENVE